MIPVASPFKFLDSYQQSDNDVYFGREKETTALYQALSGVKHMLIYGPSGAGKTSLIECGLRNRFSDVDWYALTIRRGQNINASVFSAINDALIDKIELDNSTGMPVDEQTGFSDILEQLYTERFQPVYLLFDQFEELLISGDEKEQKLFFQLLYKLVRYKLPCRILLIMREEFIGHLSEFEIFFPGLFQYRFRVEQMGRKNVEEVISKILNAPRYKEQFEVTDIEQLTLGITARLPDKKKDIELAHIQVFLQELWQRAVAQKKANKLPVLQAGLVKDSDNLSTVLESFLKNQLQELEQIYGKDIPLELLAVMITEKSTKLQLSKIALEKELQQNSITLQKSLEELLKELHIRRIIRTIRCADEIQYEISHDVLAMVVGQNRTEEMKQRQKAEDVYKVYMQRQGLFTQDDIDFLRPLQQYLPAPAELQEQVEKSIDFIKQRRQEELQKARRRLRTVYSLLGCAILAMFAAVLFAVSANGQKRKANKALAEFKKEQLEKEKAQAENQQKAFSELENRANIVLEANGCPRKIVREMDSLLAIHKINSPGDSLIWKQAIENIKAKSKNCP